MITPGIDPIHAFQGLRIRAAETPIAMAEAAASRFTSWVSAKPDLVVCLPTGRTPLAFYAQLRQAALESRADFSRIRILMVDEYAGAPPDAEWSFSSYIEREVIAPLGIAPPRVLRIDGRTRDPEAEARRFEAGISEWGGLDLAVLGLGRNGHLGFNEPGSPLDAGVRVAELAADTIAANIQDLPEVEHPTLAITIGLGTIRAANAVMLLVGGEQKQDALSALINGGDPMNWPVAALRNHENVDVFTQHSLLPDLSGDLIKDT